ncbi:unnamed protein product [Nesidiocoris tenuis]|uniref:tRNA (carboxymethyluridine(34)-5-O)-methyltransferase n=1 Tax=Nesidiocoris tenuis TaxID=355587 RepID=A0A6H5HE84_9HEMI|nr:unnamed protein product [Nesidiocoris tenuis]
MSGRQVSSSKLNKKMAKYTSILQKLYGMSPASLPSRTIMVCNAGLSLGLNKEDLLEAFGGFGKIAEILMISKESHAFIEYFTVDDAEECFRRCNGKIVVPKVKGPLYVMFLESFPKIENTEVFQMPPGCYVFEDFISVREEQILLDCVKEPLEAGGDLKQRRVAHFGYEFIYGKNDIDKDNPLERGIPTECAFVRDRLTSRGFDLGWDPDQLTVNHYFPGQGIPAHVDTHSAFEDPILSLSLSADTVMEFKRPGSHYMVVLPRRSLLVMSGESRYAWTHSIAARKNDIVLNGGLHTKERGVRVSFTFRRIRKTPCDCDFHQFCDSRLSGNIAAELEPSTLEGQFVHKVYEDISDHFSQTRHKPWPAVLDLVKSLEVGSVLLDVGCGNCKYFGHAKQIFEVGSDHSAGLLNISHDRGFQTVRNNCLSLPIRDGVIDCVICIAVIHHLSSSERRIHSVSEILRVLSDSGKALIYVWAKDQKYKGSTSNYLKYGKKNNGHPVTDEQTDGTQKAQKEPKVNLPVHVNGTDFSQCQNDVLVPWKLKTTSSSESASTFLRYYHVFDEGELDLLCEKAGAKILKTYYDNGNWCCLIAKAKVT